MTCLAATADDRMLGVNTDAPSEHDLPWVTLLARRCEAVREQRVGALHWGRCELRRHHDGDHALDRGFDVVRWSTDWTQHPVVNR